MKFSTPSLFLVIAIAFCCSEEEQDSSNATNTTVEYEPAITPVGTPEGDPITKTIGISGGSIVSPDSVMELVIPAGALPANTDITIQPITNEAPGGIGLAYDLLPDGTTFSKPATLTFHYTDEDINGSSPLDVYIAYQDEAGAWVSDLQNQVLDTLAKTTSLDISHFTGFGQGTDNIKILGGPLTLRAGQLCNMNVFKSSVIEGSPGGERRTQIDPVTDDLVSHWRVVGGNSSDGSILELGATAVYTAPASIDRRRTVKISAHVNVTVTTVNRGRQIVRHGVDPVLRVTLEPEPPRKYEIEIEYVDSVLSSFHGRKNAEIPVYKDKAKINMEVKFVNDRVKVEAVHIQNDPPTVTPATKTYDGTKFTWIPDAFGMIDIEKVELHGSGVLTNSILQFNLVHKHATAYGREITHLGTGKTERLLPTPFASGSGYPSSFQVDLNKNYYHYDSSHDDGFSTNPITITVFIKPQ